MASPDQLPDILRSAVDMLVKALPTDDGLTGLPSWPATAAERLLQNANPVFTRSERPAPEKTTAIRLAALCLACEADGIGREDIGAMFGPPFLYVSQLPLPQSVPNACRSRQC